MSYRSSLLLTTICVAFGSAAAIDPAAAHGGGGFGGGVGGFNAAGNVMHTATPVTSAVKPSFSPLGPVPTNLGGLGTHGNGPVSKPTSVGPAPKPSSLGKPYTGNVSKPVVPPIAELPVGKPNTGIATKVNGVPPIAELPVGKPNTSIGTKVNGVPPIAELPVGKPYTGIGTNVGGVVLPNVPPPKQGAPGTQPQPQAQPPVPPTDNGKGIPIIITGGGPEVVVADDPDGEFVCHWVKRKIITPDDDVIFRRVKVCETVDPDQQ